MQSFDLSILTKDASDPSQKGMMVEGMWEEEKPPYALSILSQDHVSE